MSDARRRAVARFLARFATLCEVGIGDRTSVAAHLAAGGATVTAVDIEPPASVPDGVRVVRDDVVAASRRTEPGVAYQADAIYGLNLPPELHRPVARIAAGVDAAFVFTTLGTDPPLVPAEPVTVGRATVFEAEMRGPKPHAPDSGDPDGFVHGTGGQSSDR